jgi:hypothetical protein
MEHQLGQGCFPCILEMHSAREEASQGFDAEKIRPALDEWDASRLKRKFQHLLPEILSLRSSHRADWHESLAIQQLLCSLLEVLMRPRLLAVGGLDPPFTACLIGLLDLDNGGGSGTTAGGGLTISAGRWLAGVYYLCAHANDRVRSWARSQVSFPPF